MYIYFSRSGGHSWVGRMLPFRMPGLYLTESERVLLQGGGGGAEDRRIRRCKCSVRNGDVSLV